MRPDWAGVDELKHGTYQEIKAWLKAEVDELHQIVHSPLVSSGLHTTISLFTWPAPVVYCLLVSPTSTEGFGMSDHLAS